MSALFALATTRLLLLAFDHRYSRSELDLQNCRLDLIPLDGSDRKGTAQEEVHHQRYLLGRYLIRNRFTE